MPACRLDHRSTPSLSDACDAVFSLDAPALRGLVRSGRRWAFLDGPDFDVPEDLIGFVAPSSWDGLAVVVTGTARLLDTADTGGTPRRARVTFALDRAGLAAGTVTTIDGTTRLDLTEHPPVGHLADFCHRILGLPATPESSTPDDAVSAGWLADVLAAHDVLGPGFPLEDWEGLISLHPLHGSASGMTWDDVHADLVASQRGWGELDADDVAWTDPPTLARLILADLPSTSWLLDEVGRRAGPEVLAHVQRVVGGTGGSGLRRDRAG